MASKEKIKKGKKKKSPTVKGLTSFLKTLLEDSQMLETGRTWPRAAHTFKVAGVGGGGEGENGGVRRS